MARGNDTSASDRGWDIVLEENMSISFDVGLPSGSSRSYFVDVGLQYGRQVLLTFTYDSFTGEQKVWADGRLISTKNNSPSSIQSYDGPLVIAKGDFSGCSDGAGYVPGVYDDVRIYDRALSESEIHNLYDSRGGAATSFSIKRSDFPKNSCAEIEINTAPNSSRTFISRGKVPCFGDQKIERSITKIIQ
jgi:hypothetical protein